MTANMSSIDLSISIKYCSHRLIVYRKQVISYGWHVDMLSVAKNKCRVELSHKISHQESEGWGVTDV